MQKQAETEEILKLIETLKEEHREILYQIEKIENSDPVDEEGLKRLFDFLNSVHHQKEEQMLFPALAQSKCLIQGGPLCGYFMGLRLDLDQLEPMRSHLKKFSQKTGMQFVDKELPPWLSPQNYLSIPMEEHEVAHMLNKALMEIIERENIEWKEEFFELLLTDYFKLLKLHIQKEDSCLFVQCTKNCR